MNTIDLGKHDTSVWYADTKELFECCKRGELSRIQYLVEKRCVNIHVQDQWECSPVHYACVCGHSEVAEYLIELGAEYVPDPLDADRVKYVKWEEILCCNILKTKYNVPHYAVKRNSYPEFLRRLLQVGNYSDIRIIVNGVVFSAHKCILAARCPVFCLKLKRDWENKSVIILNSGRIKPSAFKCILQYLYCGRMKMHLDRLEDCLKLAVCCNLPLLKEELEKAIKKKLTECVIPLTDDEKVISLHSDKLMMKLQKDLTVLSLQAIPPQFVLRGKTSEASVSDPNVFEAGACALMPCIPTEFVDICFDVGGHKFWCHKAFFCLRSEYFSILLQDHFSETEVDEERGVPIMQIHNVPAQAFAVVVHYMYTNIIEVPEDYSKDVVLAADLFVLVHLKKACYLKLERNITIYNVVQRMLTARFFKFRDLIEVYIKFVVDHLDEMAGIAAFRELLIKDTKQVCDPRRTRSILLVEQMRRRINCLRKKKGNEKFAVFVKLLKELRLDD